MIKQVLDMLKGADSAPSLSLVDSDLVGQKILYSRDIDRTVSQLVDQVQALNQEIQGVRAPRADFVQKGKNIVDLTGAVRGRPLNYPYVGSGAGRGVYVELEDGSVKMDLINGIGIHLMGHSNPRVMRATLRGSLCDVVNQGNLQPNKEYTQFLKKITEIAGRRSRLKYGWLSTCGTMANENAVKISRQKRTPARMILAFKNAFAGRSTLMAEVTDNPAYKVGLPEYNEVLRIPFFDKRDSQSSEKTLRAMKEHVSRHEGNISIFGFEPMLGEGGYQPAPREFFLPLLDFCKEQKIVIWADEVQTFARTGEFFAFERLDIGNYIDICTLAKTAQVGVTLYTEEMNPAPGLIAGTFSGASPALSAGLEILNMLEEGYLGPQGRIYEIHNKFVNGLTKLSEGSCKGKVHDPGGLGLMVAFTPFEGKKEQVDVFLKKLFANGIVAFSCGKDPVRIRFLIPAVITDQDIAIALAIIEKTLIEGV